MWTARSWRSPRSPPTRATDRCKCGLTWGRSRRRPRLRHPTTSRWCVRRRTRRPPRRCGSSCSTRADGGGASSKTAGAPRRGASSCWCTRSGTAASDGRGSIACALAGGSLAPHGLRSATASSSQTSSLRSPPHPPGPPAARRRSLCMRGDTPRTSQTRRRAVRAAAPRRGEARRGTRTWGRVARRRGGRPTSSSRLATRRRCSLAWRKRTPNSAVNSRSWSRPAPPHSTTESGL
mmetsp:Transcript_11472/g.28378  ORF Transcript_11472/g.28378 Transcript_11472/m.28378 type:complete len:235 (-) Transcript_11472:749-1453(-)